MEIKLAFIGFGSVSRAFARILKTHQTILELEYGVSHRVTAIATASHGCITSTTGIDPAQAAVLLEGGGRLTDIPGSTSHPDALSVTNKCKADIMFETTPLNVVDGQPAIAYISAALERGIHVVTANKGPLAFGFSALKSLAGKTGACFRFEGTVMDGAPVFNLVESCLPGIRVLGFRGALNSTTNLIIDGMQAGRSFGESLADAQQRGIAEANADYDIEGWDAAVKAAALANVLMKADVRPMDVAREGIRNVTTKDLASAAASGKTIRLISRGKKSNSGVSLSVAPELVPLASTIGCVRGSSNVLIIETDLMGDIAIVENEPGVEQTAYALLSDMIEIGRHLKGS